MTKSLNKRLSVVVFLVLVASAALLYTCVLRRDLQMLEKAKTCIGKDADYVVSLLGKPSVVAKSNKEFMRLGITPDANSPFMYVYSGDIALVCLIFDENELVKSVRREASPP